MRQARYTTGSLYDKLVMRGGSDKRKLHNLYKDYKIQNLGSDRGAKQSRAAHRIPVDDRKLSAVFPRSIILGNATQGIWQSSMEEAFAQGRFKPRSVEGAFCIA
jgi:hypothetical protein